MSGMTFDSLSSDIALYAEREDDPFVAQIPNFISLAENRLASEVKPLGYLRVARGVLSGSVLEKPVRWRRTKSLSVSLDGVQTFLFERSYEYCRLYSGEVNVGYVPRYYADYDYEHFFIAPSPSIAYQFELLYYERPAPLGSNNQTNWTTQYAPQLLLYGALLEAQPFLKTSERIPEFQAMFDRALSAIVNEDATRSIDSSS